MRIDADLRARNPLEPYRARSQGIAGRAKDLAARARQNHFDGRRGLLWGVDASCEVYVLRLDPASADLWPME